jgi:glycosyltransferase involved in cell wall biosynthesis
MEVTKFNPKVSIVIPVYMGPNYKNPDYLREAIESALAQTYMNIEVIVVNDGSNDGGKTEEIAKSYGDKIRYFSKENGGVSTALNLGIQQMTGEYFSWLSHDDMYYPEKIEKQVRYLENKMDKNIITYCAEEMIDENSQTIQIFRIDKRYLKNIYLTILSTSIGGCSLLIPKVCFDKVGLFNEKLKTTQDNEMWLRIARAGFQFKHLPDILVKSRVHAEQVSNVLSGSHQKETDDFYIWAIHHLGDGIRPIWGDVERILRIKKCRTAQKELKKMRHKKSISGSISHAYCYLTAKLGRIFFRSSTYWEKRYAAGGDSGVGSFGKLAFYKAGVINSFIRENNIKNVIEFGCGDGNQLQYFDMPEYIGVDVSKTAVETCKKRFAGDIGKEFYAYDQFVNKADGVKKAELTLSVDVLYHLVEDEVFQSYISELFRYSSRYVVIYSTNFNKSYDSPHQRDREFTQHIENTIKSFKLIETIVNPYKGEKTMSDFFIYRRIM